MLILAERGVVFFDRNVHSSVPIVLVLRWSSVLATVLAILLIPLGRVSSLKVLIRASIRKRAIHIVLARGLDGPTVHSIHLILLVPHRRDRRRLLRRTNIHGRTGLVRLVARLRLGSSRPGDGNTSRLTADFDAGADWSADDSFRTGSIRRFYK